MGLGRIVACMVGCACGRLDFQARSGSTADAHDARDIFDAEARSTPAVLGTSWVHANNMQGGAIASTIPAATSYALAIVQVGQLCNPGFPSPTVDALLLGGQRLRSLYAMDGTACDAASTHSEVFALARPAPGPAQLEVTLSDPVDSLHVHAVYFAGGNAEDPIRAGSIATLSGVDVAASVITPSAPGDLVFSFVGQGHFIVGAGGGMTEVFKDNASYTTTLDNTAAATRPGSAPSVTTSWIFDQSDEYQLLSLSLVQ